MRLFRAVGLFALIAALPAESAELVVKVEGVRSAQGLVRLALYDKAEGFAERGREITAGAVTAANGQVVYRFHELAPGIYAVTLYHDENANDKFDFTWIGLPDEGYGFSNGAKALLSAPAFEDAAIAVDDGNNDISIKLTYWLAASPAAGKRAAPPEGNW